MAEGVAIPQGIYDLKKKRGYLPLGTSHDTSELGLDCLRSWWQTQGQWDYPEAKSVLVLCDGGGSNACRPYLFKEELEKLVQEAGLEVRVAHYPSYASKYNPIEHRLFAQVTRVCRGSSSPASRWSRN